MKQGLAAFFAGLIFSIGLGISGMTQPQKIIGFLDFFDNWDPSLLFVMMGAVGLHFISYRVIRRLKHPLLSNEWFVPVKNELTPSLIAGSVIFGVGWGLGGFCPGAGITSLASFESKPFIFVLSMLIGMFLFRHADSKFKFRK